MCLFKDFLPDFVCFHLPFPERYTVQICQHDIAVAVHDYRYNAAVHFSDAALGLCRPETCLLNVPSGRLFKVLLQFRTVSPVPKFITDHVCNKRMRFDDHDLSVSGWFDPKYPFYKFL